MRMFLVGMCDIFLILYLTALSDIKPKTTLTIDDFLALKSMHEKLKKERDQTEKEFKQKILEATDETKAALDAKAKQEEELKSEITKIAQQKNQLDTQVANQKTKNEKLQKDVSSTSSDLAKAQKNLQAKDKDLLAKDKSLKNLKKLSVDELKKLKDLMALKEKERKKMQLAYNDALRKKKAQLDAANKLAGNLQSEATSAKNRAAQLQITANKALADAKNAKISQQEALALKAKADAAKVLADKKAKEAIVAKQKADKAKEAALISMKTARKQEEIAKQEAKDLSTKIQIIKQDGQSAYSKNIIPKLQKVHITFTETSFDRRHKRERSLKLLPVKLDDQNYVLIPLKQLGFDSSEKPDNLKIIHQKLNIKEAWISKKYGLLALPLKHYAGTSKKPYDKNTNLSELMPTLLALRNNSSKNLSDKIRGLSRSFFIVNRDFLAVGKNSTLNYKVKGFRGTGRHGERIIRGDQLVDLNGQLIGIANETNTVTRISSIAGWQQIRL